MIVVVSDREEVQGLSDAQIGWRLTCVQVPSEFTLQVSGTSLGLSHFAQQKGTLNRGQHSETSANLGQHQKGPEPETPAEETFFCE